MNKKILIVDDEELIRKMLDTKIKSLGYETILAENGKDAIEILKNNKEIDLVLCDIFMPEVSGFEVLKFIKKNCPEYLLVIIMTAYANIETAVKAMEDGAFDYLIKPFTIEEIPYLLNRCFTYQNLLKKQSDESLKDNIEIIPEFPEIIGISPYIKNLKNNISKIIKNKENKIFISGEKGTGKNLIAQIIAKYILNKNEIKDVIINLSGYDGNLNSLLDNNYELYIFEESEKISPKLQKEFCNILTTENLNNRILVFTTTKFSSINEIKNYFISDFVKIFNENFIFTEPLRTHKEDIPLFLEFFLDKYNKKYGKNIKDFDKESLYFLLHYSWPDNLIEMENVIENAVFNCNKETISPDLLSIDIVEQKDIKVLILNPALSYKDALQIAKNEIDKHYIEMALKMSNGKKKQAAKILNISLRELYYRIKALGLK